MSLEQGDSAEPQDVKDVETPTTEDVKVETPETKETVDEPTTEETEPELTVEEKLEKAEQDIATKQKKIDRQTAANRKTQQLYEEQRQEREKLAGLIEKQQPDKEPVIDDFETHEEYVDALVKYRSKAEVQKQQQERLLHEEQIRDEQVNTERLQLRTSQETEFIVDNPMYKAAANEVDIYVKELGNTAPGTTQEAVIAQLYRGNVPQVINYFGANNGENLSELGDLSRLSPPEAAVEIYKIQQKLGAPTKKETKPSPTPVKVEKGSSSNNPKSPLKMPEDKFRDWIK